MSPLTALAAPLPPAVPETVPIGGGETAEGLARDDHVRRGPPGADGGAGRAQGALEERRAALRIGQVAGPLLAAEAVDEQHVERPGELERERQERAGHVGWVRGRRGELCAPELAVSESKSESKGEV